MTHTSTEQPDPWVIIEKLRAQHRAEIHETWMPLVADLRSQLEASQAQRVPLDYHDIAMAHVHIGAHGQLPATERIVRWTEAAHGITQENQ